MRQSVLKWQRYSVRRSRKEVQYSVKDDEPVKQIRDSENKTKHKKKKTLQFTYKALYSKVKEGNESVKGVRKR